jgi:hypothetical protein
MRGCLRLGGAPPKTEFALCLSLFLCAPSLSPLTTPFTFAAALAAFRSNLVSPGAVSWSRPSRLAARAGSGRWGGGGRRRRAGRRTGAARPLGGSLVDGLARRRLEDSMGLCVLCVCVWWRARAGGGARAGRSRLGFVSARGAEAIAFLLLFVPPFHAPTSLSRLQRTRAGVWPGRRPLILLLHLPADVQARDPLRGVSRRRKDRSRGLFVLRPGTPRPRTSHRRAR